MIDRPTEPVATPSPSEAASGAAAQVGRRALLVTAGLGVCAAGAVATPLALKYAGDVASAEANQALQHGIDLGRQELLAELKQLENVAIDDAVAIAELTRLGVKYIVLPVAQLVATIGGDALQVVLNAIGFANGIVHNSVLDALYAVIKSWHDNLTQLPITLSSYANADINGAETYLKALQAKINAAGATDNGPTPTPTR
jgi:hypothetical protein